MKKYTTSTVAKAIYESLKNKQGVEFENSLKNSVSFLQKKKLLSKKKEILDAVKKLEHKDKGVLEAKIKSASPLGENLKKDLSSIIASKYGADKVELSAVTDPKLLDGLIIEVGEEVIDLSARGRIKKLENYLISKI